MTGEPTGDTVLKGQTSLRSSLAANIAANAVIAGAFILSVPLLIRYIGVEGYGLIGFFVVAQSIALVLDLGLNVVLTREFAVGRGAELRTLLRTSEIVYWLGALLIAVVWTLSAGGLRAFLNPEGLSSETVDRSLLLMGPAVALQIPISLYSGALFGLQRQALVSVVGAVFSVLRNLGAIPLLHFFSADPQTYFGWQLLCAAIHSTFLAVLTWRSLPDTGQSPRFAIRALTAQWRFALGVGFITLGTTLLAHVDKFVLARLLSLESFGLYIIAATAANGLHWLIQPVFRAVLPRLATHAESDQHKSLAAAYHHGSQLMAGIVFPVAAGWMFFSYELMMLWQQNINIANGTYLLVTLLMAGGVLNALQHMPYALQIAVSRTRLHLFAVLLALAISLPLTVVFSSIWGATGAAAVNVLLYGLILLVVVPMMHRHLLPGEGWKWLLRDVLLPASFVGAAGGLCRLFFVETFFAPLLIVQLSVAFAIMGLSGLAGSWLARR